MTGLQGQIAAGQVSASFSSREREAPTPSWFTNLVRRLDLHEREVEIRRCFDMVCADSLRPGAGWSSLNIDGTPVQFALSLVKGQRPAFEFIGEAFRSGMAYAERRGSGLESMARLAETIGVKTELNIVRSHLAALGDDRTAGDCEDPAGAFWLGAAFESAGSASMTIYANARRGTEAARWKRLAEFAGSIADADWPRVFAIAEAGDFKPLGAGARIRKERRPDLRVYFAAYGVKLQDYRRMYCEAGAGEPFDNALTVFFETALGEDAAFPTRSAVFSFGSNGDGEWAPKLELCGHCAWRTDDEAKMLCGTWLERMGMDADVYRDAVRILTDDERRQQAGVHAYVGVGMRRDQPYASIYLNPGRSRL